MENLKQKVDAFNALVQDFKLVEAVDRFYDENIVSHENEDEPVKGLKDYREAVVKFQEAVGKGAGQLKNVLVSHDVSVAEWHYVFDHPEYGHMDYLQVSVQRWKNGKIVHERHHYKTEKW
jgi:hypothetical protein